MAASGFFSEGYQEKLAKILARSRAGLPLTSMKWFTVLVGSILLLGSYSSRPPSPKTIPLPPVSKPQQSKGPVRGTWLATVSHLDWPSISSVNISSPTVRISQQQKTLMDKLDNLKRLDINTVFFQVKPDGTALWKSKILPWSDILTGTIGQDPGYDPLQSILDETHKCGMKIHAWSNLYHMSVNIRPSTVSELNSVLSQTPSGVYVLHRDWVHTTGERFVLDPGIPGVRGWITSIVAEVVENYPVDGVQPDDYFYTESPGSTSSDNQTFRGYSRRFTSRTDWRHDNTQRLIAQASRTIKRLKPEVGFGVSPAGVQRNHSHDPVGSGTRDAAIYDESYADTCHWVQLGLLSCIVPQLYWLFARDAAHYNVLAKWQAGVMKSINTRLYVGIALYKVGELSRRESDWAVEGGVPELKKQLDLDESEPYINGTVLFREGYLSQPQTQEAVTYIHNRQGRQQLS